MGLDKKIDLLLHFGFPKASSSTLQFGLFSKLQNADLARLFTWRQYDQKELHDFRPSSCLFQGKSILKEYLDFKPDILNILSDESFTAPIRLRRNNFGNELKHPYSFPQKIKEQIDDQFDVVNYHCLIVLRNQTDLLFSQYVEEHNLLKYKEVNLLFDKDNKLNLEGYDIYYYSTYLKILEKVFGPGSVTILFYEDLKNGEQDFFRGLSNCLPISEGEIKTELQSSRFNVKVKNKEGYLTKDNKLIRFFTEEQKNTIYNHFLADNLELKKIESIAQKITQYGYV